MTSPLFAWLDRWAEDRPEHPAIQFEEESISYAELRNRVAAAHAWLGTRDVAEGDRVAWLGGNEPTFLELMLGCARAGAIFVPLNNRLTETELEFQLADCGPAVSVAGDGFTDTLARAASDSNRVVNYQAGSRQEPAPASVEASTDALIVYTSGTTGRPKGAVHTHGSLAATVANGIAAHDLTSADVALAFLPLFHVGGLTIQTLPTLAAGGTVVLLAGFDPNSVFHAADRYGPTVSLVVPATMAGLIDHPRWPGPLAKLRGVMAGSSIVPVHLLETFNEAGIPAGQVYGSTETGPTAVVLPFDEANHVGTVGRAASGSQFRLVDGEVQVVGPHLFRGYWDNPDATAAAFDHGWFRMGDIGHLDDAGLLVIDDRVSDMLISGGENVYPVELEDALADCPGVAELCVVGMPDDRWGETPVAVVVPEVGGTPTLAEIRTHAEARLARYKLPTRLELVDSLPRTALGKVRKFEVVRMISEAGGERSRS